VRGCANTNTPCPPTSPTLASQKMPNACGKHASAVAPGDRQPWPLRRFRRRRLRRPVAVGSITRCSSNLYSLEYQFGVLRLRTQICKICIIPMKSSKFNENLANLKLQHFLGPAFWGRRCGSPAPKFWEGLPTPPKRPVRRPAGHHFGGAGGDALTSGSSCKNKHLSSLACRS
jgi:hypothetical protein